MESSNSIKTKVEREYQCHRSESMLDVHSNDRHAAISSTPFVRLS
jgi:hypothetical protein